jgi:hypothetical protein
LYISVESPDDGLAGPKHEWNDENSYLFDSNTSFSFVSTTNRMQYYKIENSSVEFLGGNLWSFWMVEEAVKLWLSICNGK